MGVWGAVLPVGMGLVSTFVSFVIFAKECFWWHLILLEVVYCLRVLSGALLLRFIRCSVVVTIVSVMRSLIAYWCLPIL